MRIEPSLDQLVEQAREGNEEALEAVVRAIQDRIYNLALRMLWHPSDAEDATQEILLKVITRQVKHFGYSRCRTETGHKCFHDESHCICTTLS